MPYFFSVAMSVYDGVTLEQFKYSSSSILEQSFDDFEFIIVLDGVTKKELIDFSEHLSNAYDNVKIISYSENRGLAYAMNKAISAMLGTVFVRMDADDISLNNRLSEIYKFLNDNEDIDVVGSYTCEQDLFISSKYDPSARLIKYPTSHQEIVELFKYRNPISHPTAAIRKRVFDDVPGYPLFSLRNEDTLLWLSFIKNDVKFSNIPQALYLFHFDSGAVSRRASISKSYSDFLDRGRVIFDLGGGGKHMAFAFLLFLLTITPCYSWVRKFALRKKND